MDIPNHDQNRAFSIAKKHSKDKLSVDNGVELSRKMPLGNCNAIFIKNSNNFKNKNEYEIFNEAKKQKAFTFWNHPYHLITGSVSPVQ